MNVRDSFQKQLGEALGSCGTKVLPYKGSSALTGKPYTETKPESLLFFLEAIETTLPADSSGIPPMPEIELKMLSIGVEELDELCNKYEMHTYSPEDSRIPTLVKKK